jgi:multidrug efflux pump subunit AcrB
VKTIFKATPGVVDVDWYIEADQQKARFIIDKEKAALHGISAATISQTLKIAVDGETVDLLHQPEEKEDVNIRLELPRSCQNHARRASSHSACVPAMPMRCLNPVPAARRSCRCASW